MTGVQNATAADDQPGARASAGLAARTARYSSHRRLDAMFLPLIGRNFALARLDHPIAQSKSRALAQQEVERRSVEGLRVLVQPGVRQVVEDHQLAPGDSVHERIGEAR